MEICRAITFINYHIPMTGEIDNSEIQYATVGFFDGMMTEKIKISDSENELKNLWKYSLKCTAKGMGKYSFQNIFCFSQDEWNEFSDNEIWTERTDEKYPLTFIVFLQLKDYLSGDNAIAEQCKAFSTTIKEKIREGYFYSYCTVDKNDFVICLKCRNYGAAVEAIKSLHQTGKDVVYSYTVFSVSYKVLNLLNETDYEDIYNEKIKSICLKGIANSFNPTQEVTLDQKYNEFGEEIVKRLYGNEKESADYKIYDILGDDDFRLIAREVKLGILLKQLGKGGLLCNQGSSFRFYLFSSTLVLNTETPEQRKHKISNSYIEKNEQEMQKEFQSPICLELQKKMVRISKEITKQGEQVIHNEKVTTFCNAIWQLLQSLKALEIPATKKYDFWSLYNPLSLLVEILEEKMEKYCKNVSTGTICELGEKEEIFEFIHKISMTLHGTLRTDIQFFQIRDFNATVHYAPAKLRAFYALWALQLSDYYNDFCEVKNQYSFIFSPGMFSIISVKQLFTEYVATKRLMLITVPERLLYSPKWLSIVLAHEVSHFVGYQVRQREKRHELWLKCCARLLFLEMNHYRYVVCKQWENELEISLRNSNLDDKFTECLLEEERLIRRKENLWPHEFHSANSIMIIQKSFQKLAHNHIEKLVGDDCERILSELRDQKSNSSLSYKEKIQIDAQIRSMSYGNEKSLLCIFQKFQVKLPQFLEIFKHIMVEVCADINAILTLELKPEEYFLTFSKAEKYFDTKDIEGNQAFPLIVRLALVLEAIKCKIAISENPFIRFEFIDQWVDFKIGKWALSLPENSVEQRIALSIYSYKDGIRNCNNKISIYQSLFNNSADVENYEFKCLDFLNDEIIWNEMLEYVTACVEEYIKILKKDNHLIEQKRTIMNTYSNITQGSPTLMVQEIENFLDYFEKKCCKISKVRV